MLDIKQLIKDTLEKMKLTLQTEIAQDTPAVMGAVTGYIADAQVRLTNLAEGVMSKELSYFFVVERLKDEPLNIKNQLRSIGLILATDIDELAAKTVLILEEALKDAIDQSKLGVK